MYSLNYKLFKVYFFFYWNNFLYFTKTIKYTQVFFKFILKLINDACKFLYNIFIMVKEPILCYFKFYFRIAYMATVFIYRLYPPSLPTSPMYLPIPLKFMTSTSMWTYTRVYKTYWGYSVAIMYVGLGLTTLDCTIYEGIHPWRNLSFPLSKVIDFPFSSLRSRTFWKISHPHCDVTQCCNHVGLA